MSKIEKKTSLVGILVIFDNFPTRDSLQQIISSGISKICLVNNCEDKRLNTEDFKDLINKEIFIVNNFNKGGLAGAYNKAKIFISENLKETTHILYLDDDSQFLDLKAFLQNRLTKKEILNRDYLILGPRYRDSRTKMLGRLVLLSRFWFKVFSPSKSGIYETSFIINSFSIWSKKALDKIGDHDESLAIDHIDTDFCMRARKLNIPIMVNNNVTFEHTIGKRVQYSFLGFKLQSSGHSFARRKLIARNTRILMFRYGLRDIGFFFLCATRILYEFFSVLVAEKQKSKKVYAMLVGLISK